MRIRNLFYSGSGMGKFGQHPGSATLIEYVVVVFKLNAVLPVFKPLAGSFLAGSLKVFLEGSGVLNR
jgi:hypothetical protein